MKEPGREVTGEIKFIHQFVNMPEAKATYLNPKTQQLENVRNDYLILK